MLQSMGSQSPTRLSDGTVLNNFATQYLDLQLSFTLLQLPFPTNSPPFH